MILYKDALPAGWLMEKVGYKGGILVGLLICATGALLFIPASIVGAYSFFLFALFVAVWHVATLPRGGGQSADSEYAKLVGTAAASGQKSAMPSPKDVALKLVPILEEKMSAVNATRLFNEVEMPLIDVLADMEREGIDVAARNSLAENDMGAQPRLRNRVPLPCRPVGNRLTFDGTSKARNERH